VTDDRTDFFYSLTPERVLDAVELDGRRCTGRFIVLNSYENRVYQLELTDESYVVAKFYRPGRWSDDAILDEHDFLLDLQDAEVPVAAPMVLPDGSTVGDVGGIRFSLFPRIGGRAPEEMNDDQLRQLGRLLARLHTVGRGDDADHRPTMSPETYIGDNLRWVLDAGMIPDGPREPYAEIATRIQERIAPLFEGVELQRIHGDCHLGNLLWTPAGLVFLDFDDMVMGPVAQDLWLMVGGRDAWAQRRLQLLLEGYESMLPFPRGTLRLFEPLRAMRMVHWAAWIARRWEDPAFPLAFPSFGTRGWWEAEVGELQRQLGRIDEAVAQYAAPMGLMSDWNDGF
jgi:Ser/Thr protein kinase RdoA (MazF antagonist)